MLEQGRLSAIPVRISSKSKKPSTDANEKNNNSKIKAIACLAAGRGATTTQWLEEIIPMLRCWEKVDGKFFFLTGKKANSLLFAVVLKANTCEHLLIWTVKLMHYSWAQRFRTELFSVFKFGQVDLLTVVWWEGSGHTYVPAEQLDCEPSFPLVHQCLGIFFHMQRIASRSIQVFEYPAIIP